MENTSKRKRALGESVAAGLIIIGGIIPLAFLILRLNTDQIGPWGDAIGGISGSLWALAGVVYFYFALTEQRKDLQLQRKALDLQREELALQRQEFVQNRALTIVYKQIERIDLTIKNFSYNEASNQHLGLHGLYSLENSLNKDNWSNTELDQISKDLFFNINHLKGLFGVISQSNRVIERVAREEKIPERKLKNYLFSNVDSAFYQITNKFPEFNKAYSELVNKLPSENKKQPHRERIDKIKEINSIIQNLQVPSPIENSES